MLADEQHLLAVSTIMKAQIFTQSVPGMTPISEADFVFERVVTISNARGRERKSDGEQDLMDVHLNRFSGVT